MTYKHFSPAERYQIYALMKAGVNQAEIALILRGTNENTNGLVRQYIPKKRLLSTVTDEELKMIEDKLNFRPRKRLGFRTPHQVFHESLNRVALRP